jgi:hypothetical protein
VDIDGEAATDYLGWSVSMNAAGDRVAIGAWGNDVGGARNGAGHVRVYSWNGTTWTQLGVDIDGEAAGDQSGYSVSMNAAGDRVAIGARNNDVGGAKTDAGHVRVYELQSGTWTQLGVDIDGEAAGDQSGYSVSMNAAGNRVAIGANGNSVGGLRAFAGHVRIYELRSGTWTQLGVDIDGEAASDSSGVSVSMNAAGDRVAIGATGNGGNGSSAGHVRIYELRSGTWTQLGVDIDGEAASDSSGVSVSMNAAGDRVAIGATGNDGRGSNSGHVRIYSWNGAAWTQLGVDINGEAAGDQSGRSVSMNAAGDRVAIGATGNKAGNAIGNWGHVRVYYDYLIGNRTSIYQLGVDINGKAANDESGYSVSMNAAGDRVAIGAHLNDANGLRTNAGHVRVYQLQSGTWTQLGVDIDGEAANDESGYSVSMNAAGDRVAIGAPNNLNYKGHVRVYELQSGTWTQLGIDIDGEAVNDQSGWSVSMNAAGDRVAIGAPGNDGNGSSAGHVRVYELQSGTWTQLGVDINGEAANDYFGSSVSMNAAGDRVAIGATNNDVGKTKTDAGHVRVYQLQSGTWTQLGVDIDGEAAGDQSGWSVSMNAAGDRVAIGAPFNNGNGSTAGHVRVYELQSGTWTQLGVDIDGEAATDQSGRSVSMNAVGDRVVIGARYNDANGSWYERTDAGHVRVYGWNGASWTILCGDIDGKVAGDQSGYSVSMNAVGDRVAIGAPFKTNNVSSIGYVRVFQISL